MKPIKTDFYSNNGQKTILVIGCMHGDEPQGKYIIEEFLDKISLDELKNKLLFIPVLNEFGYENNTRQNINGVDLNRNFPTKNWEKTEKNEYYGGETPASEEETQFLIDIINEHKPDAILTLHAPYEIVNYDGDARVLAEKISELSGYPVQKEIGYPTPGSFGTYAGIELNIPTITLEVSETEDIEKVFEKVEKVLYYLGYEF